MAPRLTLDHVNLPARDPEKLAHWYGQTLGFKATPHAVVGPGVTLFFSRGEPLARGKGFHFGFRVEDRDAVRSWSEKLGAPIAFDESDFFAIRIDDPEGNLFEIYWSDGE
jgi:catechol 2,3-dioxygenase-like lactoylglutathione lyase family enzyme